MSKVLTMKHKKRIGMPDLFVLIFLSCLFPADSDATYLEGVQFESGYRNENYYWDNVLSFLGSGYREICEWQLARFVEQYSTAKINREYTYIQRYLDIDGYAEFSSKYCEDAESTITYNCYSCKLFHKTVKSGSYSDWCTDYRNQGSYLFYAGSYIMNNYFGWDYTSQYEDCGLEPPSDIGDYKHTDESSITFKLDCAEGKIVDYLDINMWLRISTNTFPLPEDFLINSQKPVNNVSYLITDYSANYGFYYLSGYAQYKIPVNKKCGESVTLTPSLAAGYGYAWVYYIKAVLAECKDADSDGHYAVSSTCSQGDDCDDNDATVYPGAPEICGDNRDNNCDGQVDEECDKILKYVSGNGQKEDICKTLKDPFVVSANDKDVGINWQVTKSPSGSNPTITQIVTTNTDTETVSSAYLKLGSLPGTYTGEATCAECTQGSPQTFTATAQCPEVKKYYQDNYKDPYDTWCKYTYTDTKTKETVSTNTTCQYDDNGNLKNGYSQYTIADSGCALTSLAMVMREYGSQADPSGWNKFLTQINGYAENGIVNWLLPTYINSQLTLPYFTKSSTSLENSLMDSYLEKCMPIIVKVKNWKQKADGTWKWNYHWVVVTGKSDSSYSINDPGYTDRNSMADHKYNNEIYGIVAYKDTGGCR